MTGVTTRQIAGKCVVGYRKKTVGCALMTIVDLSYHFSVNEGLSERKVNDFK